MISFLYYAAKILNTLLEKSEQLLMKKSSLLLLISLTSFPAFALHCDDFFQAYQEHANEFLHQPDNIVNHLKESYTAYKTAATPQQMEQILNSTKVWLEQKGVQYVMEEVPLTQFKVSGNNYVTGIDDYLTATYGDLKTANVKVKVIKISPEGNSELNKLAKKMMEEYGEEKFYLTPHFKPWENYLKNPSQGWFTFGEGIVFDIKTLENLNQQSMLQILKDANFTRLEQFGYIPKLEEEALFLSYLEVVKKHFKVNGIITEIGGEGKELVFVFTASQDGGKLNQLADSIYDKFNGTHLVYAPSVNKSRSAYGMYSPSQNMVFISHGTIVQLRPDRTGVHELMHAFFDQVKREKGINSLFHGKIHAHEGKTITARKTGYDTYMSLEEVTTHGMNVHIESKRLYKLHEQGKYSTGLIKFIRERAVTGREIAFQGKEVMETILPLVDEARIVRMENGFTFKFNTENFKIEFPFYTTEPMTNELLRQKLKGMIEARINVYGETATNMDNVVVYANSLLEKLEAGGKLKKDEVAQMVYIGTRPRAYLMKNK